jgi:hypothetical protein
VGAGAACDAAAGFGVVENAFGELTGSRSVTGLGGDCAFDGAGVIGIVAVEGNSVGPTAGDSDCTGAFGDGSVWSSG